MEISTFQMAATKATDGLLLSTTCVLLYRFPSLSRMGWIDGLMERVGWRGGQIISLLILTPACVCVCVKPNSIKTLPGKEGTMRKLLVQVNK